MRSPQGRRNPASKAAFGAMAAAMGCLAGSCPLEPASPDTFMIVFSTTRNRNAEIYKINSDGTNPVRLTNGTQEHRGRRDGERPPLNLRRIPRIHVVFLGSGSEWESNNPRPSYY